MRLLRQKLSASVGVASLLLAAGCAMYSADEAPTLSAANLAPVETTDIKPARLARSEQPDNYSLDTVPAVIEQPARQLTTTRRTFRQSALRPGAAYEFGPPVQGEIIQPEFVIQSPFDETGDQVAVRSGLRTNALGLGLREWASSSALAPLRGQLAAQRLSYGTLGQERYDAKINLAAPRSKTGLNFDLGFVPSLSYAQEGDFSVRRVGAEFRLGQDIDQRGNYSGLPSWYFFAGADGEAVIFNNRAAGAGLGLIDGLQLRDQVTVGDIQAGLNIHRYGTNIAFNYIRREVEYELNSETFQRDEDFGGITFTWRR